MYSAIGTYRKSGCRQRVAVKPLPTRRFGCQELHPWPASIPNTRLLTRARASSAIVVPVLGLRNYPS